MKRPSIKSPCVADRYHAPNERIAEVTFPDGRGLLINLSVRDGRPYVTLYRVDGGIEVTVIDDNSDVLARAVAKGAKPWETGDGADV